MRRVRVQRRGPTWSVRLSRAAVAEAEEVWPGVLVAYDAHGVVVGLDVMGQAAAGALDGAGPLHMIDGGSGERPRVWSSSRGGAAW